MSCYGWMGAYHGEMSFPQERCAVTKPTLSEGRGPEQKGNGPEDNDTRYGDRQILLRPRIGCFTFFFFSSRSIVVLHKTSNHFQPVS